MSSSTTVALAGRWPLPGHEAVRDELLAAYGSPDRHYHDLLHLTEVLDRLDELAAAGGGFAGDVVRLAAWFHDGVYDGTPEAEERSARWAEAALADALPEARVAAVAALVRMTAHHRPAPDDADGQALSDADLGILAADDARYAAYVRAVRAEYADVPDELFRRGRLSVLQELAAKPTLFHTAAAVAAWETAARGNLAREIAELRAAEPAGHDDQRS